MLIASCTPASGPAPRILDVQPSAPEVPRYDRFELVVALEATYDNPYDVRDVELSVVFTGPDGREWPVPGFWDADDGRVADWRVRFAPSAEGLWRYRLQVQDRSAASKPYEGQFTCLPSVSHGWLQVGSWVEPATSSRYLVYHDGAPSEWRPLKSDGTSFYAVGHCNAFDLMSYGLDGDGGSALFDRMAAHGENMLVYWPIYRHDDDGAQPT